MSFPINLEQSLESKFSKIAKKINQKEIISLGLGEPDFKTPKKILKALNKGLELGLTKYSNPMGLLSLRKELVKKLKKENKISAKTSEIIITTGAKMALSLALQTILNKGDAIININPCYPSYNPQILIAELKCRLINFDLDNETFEINFNKLDKTIKKYNVKVLLINFPNNPSGKILNKNEIRKLSSIVYKHKILLISDEVYDMLNFSNKEIISFGGIKKIQKKVITINSFSKTYAMTGWRIGYMVAKNNMMNKICKMQQHLITNVPPFIQFAAISALKQNKDYLKKYNNDLKYNFDYLKNKFSKNKFIKISPSEGGLFTFVNISKLKISSDKFCSELLKKTKVACSPGIYFGKNWDNFVRISLAANRSTFIKGVNLFEKFVKSKIKK